MGVAVVVVLGLLSLRCSLGPHTPRSYSSRTLPAEPTPRLLPPPAWDDSEYPCSDCHEDEPTNRTVRMLEEEHDELEFTHGNIWCLDCHDADQRDRLHLANGTLVDFDDSWRLCTQCHPHKLADWRAGVHGKRTGSWWGTKSYQTCVSCHDPHSPHFKPLAPKPPPQRPGQIVARAHVPWEKPSNEGR
ncbi:MAG: hypothetical protein ACE5IL_01815 [Myxococcota bacterium]